MPQRVIQPAARVGRQRGRAEAQCGHDAHQREHQRQLRHQVAHHLGHPHALSAGGGVDDASLEGDQAAGDHQVGGLPAGHEAPDRAAEDRHEPRHHQGVQQDAPAIERHRTAPHRCRHRQDHNRADFGGTQCTRNSPRRPVFIDGKLGDCLKSSREDAKTRRRNCQNATRYLVYKNVDLLRQLLRAFVPREGIAAGRRWQQYLRRLISRIWVIGACARERILCAALGSSSLRNRL